MGWIPQQAAKHLGPLTILEERGGRTTQCCEACGNAVLTPYAESIRAALRSANLPEIFRPLRDGPDGCKPQT